MAQLMVNVFGGLSIALAGQPVICSSAKATELLGYLLIHRDRPHARESLAALLWPDHSAPASMRYLRQALWRLKRTFDPSDFLVAARPGLLAISPRVAADSDLLRFEQIATSLGDIPGPRLTESQSAAIVTATELYRGDLFGTWQHSWCMAERHRLREAFLRMLEQLIAGHESQGRFGDSIGAGQLLLRHDPARESGHLALMRLHQRRGDRLAALRQFELCRTALASEFGVRPSAATLALHAQLLADESPETTITAPQRRAPVTGSWVMGSGERVATLPRTAWQPGDHTRTPVLQPETAIPRLAEMQRQLDEIQASLSELHRIVQNTSRAGTDRG